MSYNVEIILPKNICKHCNMEFKPRKRFIQKYCSESCRVMDCKKRKTLSYNSSRLNNIIPISNNEILDEIKKGNKRTNKKLADINHNVKIIQIGGCIKVLYDLYKNHQIDVKNIEIDNQIKSIFEKLEELIPKNTKE
jgi:hypothetical protein